MEPFSIVLEYCKEGALISKLRGKEIISEMQKIKWCIEIARGMVCIIYVVISTLSCLFVI